MSLKFKKTGIEKQANLEFGGEIKASAFDKPP
jgi:hypothetical protein